MSVPQSRISPLFPYGLPLICMAVLSGLAGCPGSAPVDPGLVGPPIYNNTTDPTNNNASYIGSQACAACHPAFVDMHRIHGHSQQLKQATGQPPEYPPEGTRAGVPDPPPSTQWTDFGYVIGGHRKRALFVDQDGFVRTNGLSGTDSQWNLDFPPNGTVAGFVPFEPTAATPLPYDYDCFRCHTTGAMPQDPANPVFQDGKIGQAGSWVQPGIQCEACHGPGSNHPPNPGARDLYVNSSQAACGSCHTAGDDPNVILAADGFVSPYAQLPELRASGGHADFQCTFCHSPHASTTYDRARGIRNNCTACHTDMNMALHDGKTFVRGDYVEPLTCESCHMPFSGRDASNATAAVVGSSGRMGDTRSHIFRISTEPVDYTGMFTPDGSMVVKDASGQAAVTVDFVCLRCHNGIGTFALTVPRAAEIGMNLHLEFE